MNVRPDAEEERVERALREWGQRPPVTSSAAAAGLVVARLARRRVPRLRRPLLLAAAATAIVLVAGWFGLKPTWTPAGNPTIAAAPAPLPDNVVVWWLDSETPVYFVMRPGEGR